MDVSRLFVIALGFALAIPRAAAGETPPGVTPPPAYKLLRYDEDYRYLRDVTARSDAWDPVKYIPLRGEAWYLTLGGSLRERFEDYSAANFGVPGPGPDGYLLHRLLLSADLHAGNYFRGFVELGNQLAYQRQVQLPPYVDRFDVQQAFVDARIPWGAESSAEATLRIGRQEMAYGSQRLVSIRDAPNVRRSFDGIRLTGVADHVRWNIFATRPVLLNSGSLDDQPNHGQKFWGIYATLPSSFIPYAGLDVYYLGFSNDRARFAIGSGREWRQSVGGRLFGHVGRWDWDWEALGQFGRFGQRDIRAWGFSTDTGYTFMVGGQDVRGGLKATSGSGDHHPGDHSLGTYDGLFPKLAYFNQAGLLGASNVADLQPSIGLKPFDNVKITLACDFIWRETTHDAVYTAIGIPIRGTAGRPGRYTGSQLSVDLVWQASRHIAVNVGVVHVDVAKILSDVGGHDTYFTYGSLAYLF